MPKVRKSEYEARIVEPRYSMTYTLSPDGYGFERPRQPFFSRIELRDIAFAVTALTIAFFIVMYPRNGSGNILYYVVIAALSVLAGFFIHEMSHKVVARRYGCWAEFRADIRGLGLALLMSFFGFLFAAPGAVWIAGPVSRAQNGRISMAGPGSNIVVALVLLPIWFLQDFPNLLRNVAFSLYFFNVFLAAFNMIPIMPFDGSKILRWSIPVYAGTLALAGGLLILAWL